MVYNCFLKSDAADGVSTFLGELVVYSGLFHEVFPVSTLKKYLSRSPKPLAEDGFLSPSLDFSIAIGTHGV